MNIKIECLITLAVFCPFVAIVYFLETCNNASKTCNRITTASGGAGYGMAQAALQDVLHSIGEDPLVACRGNACVKPATKHKPFHHSLAPIAEVLNDLSRFCRFGTIDVHIPRQPGPGCEAPDGWYWAQPPFTLKKHSIKPPTDEETLLQALQQLVIRSLARLTYTMIQNKARVRVYIIPEDVDGRRLLRAHDNITNQIRKKTLWELVSTVNVSKEAWNGLFSPPQKLFFQSSPHISLSEIYNNLESPNPNPSYGDGSTRKLTENILDGNIPGFLQSTTLYMYQRRSVALMVQRELQPGLVADPRLSTFEDPLGQSYYANAMSDLTFYKAPLLYEGCRGAILSEDMGLGKTAICLALIAATKYQCSRPSERYSLITPQRDECLSLLKYCALSITSKSIPWRHLQEELPQECVTTLKDSPCYYEIPTTLEIRKHRTNFKRVAERVMLSSTTLVVCPDTLVQQWLLEIEKHVEKDFFKVLVIADAIDIPPVEEVNEYDIVLLSHSRFAKEEAEGNFDFLGVARVCRCFYKRASRMVDCKCPVIYRYRTPLMGLRWKRLIVDEGHTMSAHSSRAVLLAGRLRVERQYCVTGTPSSGLMGMHIGREHQKMVSQPSVDLLSERKDLERLGAILIDYLHVSPWESLKYWNKHITKSFISSSPGSAECLRQILQGIVIRHRPREVEHEVTLPPLQHKIVRLGASYNNKLNLNCFIAAIVANAVSSERTDQDYLFHPSNRKHLSRLVTNMQHSAFFWSAMDAKEVSAVLHVTEQSLEKANERNYAMEDCELLHAAAQACREALASDAWNVYSTHHEMGYFVKRFPSEGIVNWAFLETSDGAIFGKPQILAAQKLLVQNSGHPDVLQKLVETPFMSGYCERKAEERKPVPRQKEKKPLSAKGKAKKQPEAENKAASPRKVSTRDLTRNNTDSNTHLNAMINNKVFSHPPFSDAVITGTASTKLSYLMDCITVLSVHEKIIVFYEHDDIAFYIAEALEVHGIEYLIYATTLPAARRSRYVVTFNTTETYRVMIMDVKLAAHGLNISSASRIFFIQPVWQRNIEAQAIKRAHRIGQTKPVFVETLVLTGTIEEELFKRRETMTETEQMKSKGVADDYRMRTVIQDLKFLPTHEHEPQCARFTRDREFFRSVVHEIHDPDRGLVHMEMEEKIYKKKRKLGESGTESGSSTRERTPVVKSIMKRRNVGFVN